MYMTCALVRSYRVRRCYPVSYKNLEFQVFSYSKNLPYTVLTLKCGDDWSKRSAVLQSVGAEIGILYYFEDPSAVEGQIQGYWSMSPDPGQPLWLPSPDVPGPACAWFYTDDIFHVEISRYVWADHTRIATFTDVFSQQRASGAHPIFITLTGNAFIAYLMNVRFLAIDGILRKQRCN
jgi:hypothetical protein